MTVQTLEEEEEEQQAVKPKRPRATPRKRISPMQSRRHSQVPINLHFQVPFPFFYSFVCSFMIQHLSHKGCIPILLALLKSRISFLLVMIGNPPSGCECLCLSLNFTVLFNSFFLPTPHLKLIWDLQAGGKGGRENVILVEAGYYSGQYVSFITLFTYRKHPRKQASPSRGL